MEVTFPADPTQLGLVRFVAGDRAAFLEVYHSHAKAVRRWVARFFKSPFEQEEASQEVWALVHTTRRSFDVNRGALAPWLRVVTANRCRELLRAKGRRPDLSVPIDDADEALWLDTADPDAQVQEATVKAAIASFRAGLTAQEAQVLQHALLDEGSNDEVATALGVTVRQSKYLKKKLLQRAEDDVGLRTVAREVLS